MSEMVDRVARAIDPDAFDRDAFNALADHFTRAGDFEAGQESARQKARAAIAAMREPTDEQRRHYLELSYGTETMFDAHWERAIDACLK